MYFEKMTAKNFGSFQELEYDFVTGKPVLIVGKNETDDSQESNGSGKSWFQAILEYALYQTTAKKTVNKELINWHTGSVEAYVSLTIYCPIRNERMTIERIIHLKNGGSSQLSFDGKVKYSYEDKMVDFIDRNVNEWIGINKEDLQNYFIINKFRYTSFFDSANSKIVQLIGRFSNASIIEGLDKDVLKKIEPKLLEQTNLLSQTNKLIGAKEVHQENIDKEKNRDFLSEKVDEILRIQNQISNSKQDIVKLNDAIDNAKSNISAKQTELDTNNDILKQVEEQLKGIQVVSFEKEYQDLLDKTNKTKGEQNKLDKKLHELKVNETETESILKDIERNLMGSIKCPKCSHEFIPGDIDVNIEDEREQLPTVKLMLSQVKDAIIKVNNTYAQLDSKLKEYSLTKKDISSKEDEHLNQKRNITLRINTIKNIILTCSNDISRENNNIISYQDSIRLNEDKIVSLNLQVDEINKKESGIDEAKIKEYQTLIRKVDIDISIIEGKNKIIEEEILKIKQWSLSFKEFYQFLSNKTLKILQGYANKFLEDMRSDLRIKLEGYKMKADKTMSEKVTATILRNGEVHEFNAFSGGERARLEITMILAIQQAINSTHKFGGLSFCSIDEILESADGLGIVNIMKSLQGSNKTIMLTTHINMENELDFDKLKIIKEFGISRVEN